MIKSITKKTNNKKGFTLIELIVVIAILGILAAIAIPRFSGVRDDAAKRAAVTDARTMYSELEVVYAQEGKYPATFTPTGSFSGTPTYTVGTGGASYSMVYVDSEQNWKVTFNDTTVMGTLDAVAYTAP